MAAAKLPCNVLEACGERRETRPATGFVPSRPGCPPGTPDRFAALGSMHRRTILAVPALLAAPALAATPPLRPPCSGEPPAPDYPPPGTPPRHGAWSEPDLKRLEWSPPACLRWGAVRTRLAVALAGRFAATGTLAEQAARVADVGALVRIRYWSISRARWEPLASASGMLADPEGGDRPALSAAEIREGTTAYYFEEGRAGRNIHRMTVLEHSRRRVAISIENATPIRFGLINAFDAGALQSVVFLEALGAGSVGYYNILRATEGASVVTLGRDASYINRLVALYRHAAGIPTDGAPPAAR